MHLGRWHWFVALLGAALAGLCGCNGTPAPSPRPGEETGQPPEPALFRDVTAGAGIDFTYRNGEEAGVCSILETVGGGVALIDYDGDGLLDLFVPGGGYFAGPDQKEIRGYPSKLYKNLGGWKFRDVTKEVGLDGPLFYTHGAAVADYDRDGWPDLLVTGWGRLVLYHNEPDGKGGRRFRDVTREAGLTDKLWSTSAAWADLDGDGFPDLYICHYVNWSFTNHPHCAGFDHGTCDVCPPAKFDALPHLLYRNNGNGTFTDVSKQAGLRVENPARDSGRGLGVVLADLDGDGRPDIYVANDQTDNFLYLNRSRPGHIRLEEVGLASGVARDDRGAATGSMGVAVADYDGSGRPSLWVTNYEDELPALYANRSANGRPRFEFRTRAAGIAAVGRSYVGWGTGFLDVENRGWEDVVFVNGHALRYPPRRFRRAQRPVLLRNRGQGRFQELTDDAGPYFQGAHTGRGLALGDLDNDGRTDLVISHLNEALVLLRNEAGAGQHWLGVELAGRDGRAVAGARLALEVGGRRLTRFAVGGGSYLSSGDPRLVFGLGSAGHVGRLTVAWPFGETQHWDGLAVNRYWRLTEGRPEATPAGGPRTSSLALPRS